MRAMATAPSKSFRATCQFHRSDIMKDAELILGVRVMPRRWDRFRVWLGLRIIRFGGWIIGVTVREECEVAKAKREE